VNIIESIDGLPMGAIIPNSIVQADCLEAMKLIEDNSIDLILTDPPYFKFKKEAWDRQWDTSDGFLEWLDLIAQQWHRVLKPNGSLYCFASPRMAARVEVKLGDRFNVVNRITWAKPCPFSSINRGASNSGLISKETLRGYYPNTESIIFCEHYGADNIAKGEAGYGAKCDELRGFIFEPLQQYFKRLQEAIGIFWNGSAIPELYFHSGIASNIQSARVIAKHKLDWNYKQFEFITENHYEILDPLLKFTRPYEDLRLEYEDLRRPFSVTADVPYTDVWTYPTVSHYPGKHPCEKPLSMLENIILASSREGAIVLDSFSGSANTAKACINTNRRYICIEKDLNYFQTSCDRVANHSPNAPTKTKKPKPLPEGQLKLF